MAIVVDIAHDNRVGLAAVGKTRSYVGIDNISIRIKVDEKAAE
jgi:hypothetical protein